MEGGIVIITGIVFVIFDYLIPESVIPCFKNINKTQNEII
jgi:hypothetical protein